MACAGAGTHAPRPLSPTRDARTHSRARPLCRLAKEKCKDRGGAIIFIDEIDAIGTKRGDGDESGSREVQRTMLELLNQLDGFTSNDKVKVIAATNRPDTLDPALLRSGRLDRKIELPHPDEQSRVRILQVRGAGLNRRGRLEARRARGSLARNLRVAHTRWRQPLTRTPRAPAPRSPRRRSTRAR